MEDSNGSVYCADSTTTAEAPEQPQGLGTLLGRKEQPQVLPACLLNSIKEMVSAACSWQEATKSVMKSWIQRNTQLEGALSMCQAEMEKAASASLDTEMDGTHREACTAMFLAKIGETVTRLQEAQTQVEEALRRGCDADAELRRQLSLEEAPKRAPESFVYSRPCTEAESTSDAKEDAEGPQSESTEEPRDEEDFRPFAPFSEAPDASELPPFSGFGGGSAATVQEAQWESTKGSNKTLGLLLQSLQMGSFTSRARAAQALCSFACYDVQNCAAILREDGLQPITALMSSGVNKLQTLAAMLVGNLASNLDCRATLLHEGVVPPLVSLLTSGRLDAKKAAATALSNLARDDFLGSSTVIECGALPPLIQLLSRGGPEEQALVAMALRNIAAAGPTSTMVVRAGALPPLVQLLGSSYEGARVEAAWALAALSVEPANHQPLIRTGALYALVSLSGLLSPVGEAACWSLNVMSQSPRLQAALWDLSWGGPAHGPLS